MIKRNWSIMETELMDDGLWRVAIYQIAPISKSTQRDQTQQKKVNIHGNKFGYVE